MTRSMTGFGKASCEHNGALITVELSTVNHRFLDCSLRIPPEWSALEPALRQKVRGSLARGKVNVTVSRKRVPGAHAAVQFNEELARQYVERARQLAGLLGEPGENLSLNVLAQMDGVLYAEEADESLEGLEATVVAALCDALERLQAMRATEGQALAVELAYRAGQIREALDVVEARLPELNRLYADRLRERIAELKVDNSIAEERLALEVALLADRGDVTEEVVRLRGHLEHMLEFLDAEEAVGRRLEFLTQEIQREVNTLGAKVRDAAAAKEVLRMKAELEKLREQVQNIE